MHQMYVVAVARLVYPARRAHHLRLLLRPGGSAEGTSYRAHRRAPSRADTTECGRWLRCAGVLARIFARLPTVRHAAARAATSRHSIRAKAYPHIVILDSDGKRLLSRDMGGMVKKGRYSEKKLLRLLNRHK